jgi:hypothetical protein
VNDRRKRWLELLAAERRRRIEYREAHCFNLERLEAKLDEMAERSIGVESPRCAIDTEQEVTALEAWFSTHGYR